ncbi:Ppx/GppA family phosphatase [Novosphingobium sp. JCM 18896]|uniref:Ppx/GppA family phosphatase n=1 Tax=Novosphingobium sp. JCM 18896 TaxID=2989731 RepID=UPI0022234298|nr:Ppx/GppA family phosphatase [Novosphingobium sp. JCM 18896]MCW1429869.1 Ppx/GppA family phosphatase [Novosphingobium sp. JCM 18896]
MFESKRITGTSMNDRHAIIDIGSNSVRVVVYGGPPRAPTVLLNEKVTAKLGKAMGETGELSDKAMKTALAALGRYAALLRLMGITDIETVATAAARDASNGAEFLAAVEALGLSPRLLSGEEEATASAHGVMAAFPGAKGVVADLGGGSLELTEIDGKTARHGITMPFGTLRLEALRATGAQKFAARVRKALKAADWSEGAGMPMYLVGGSWRALARYAMAKLDWPLDDPHGWEVDTETAIRIFREVTAAKIKGDVPRISASRLASLPDAAALLCVLANEIKPASLVFSAWGLREGLLFRRMSPGVQAQDPMLAAVTAFAETLDVSPSSGTMVAGWTAEVCATTEPGHERLRLAATLLALAAQRIEPNLRMEQAMDWALRKRWIGIGDRERAILAVAAIANTGRTTFPDEYLRLASAADLREAVTWGLATRLCRKFSGCIAQSLTHSSLDLADGKLVLTVGAPVRPLYTEGVDKDLRLLANWLEVEPATKLANVVTTG